MLWQESRGVEKCAVDPLELLFLRMVQLARLLRFDRIMRLGKAEYSFAEYFKGLEKAESIRRIFGEKTEQVLRNLKVEFTPIGGYMWINPANGHLVIDARYLAKGSKTDVYLDLVHELVHVKQYLEGKELFDFKYDYAERPTEVEAYQHAVEEAKRLGLNDERICQYLKTEWMSNEDLRRLAKTLHVKCPA